MKFTRILSLGLIASAAMVMNACDSTSSDDPAARTLTVDTLWAGTQGSTFGSFISLAQDTAYNTAAVKNTAVCGPNACWDKVDMIFFADDPASAASQGTLYAPDEAKIRFAAQLGSAPNMKATRFFAPASDDEILLSKITTDVELNEALSKFDMTEELKTYEVSQGDVFLVRLADGTKAIVKAEIITDKGMTASKRDIQLFIKAKF